MANRCKIAFYLIFLFALVNCQEISYEPTVRPVEPFDAQTDAETLKTAIASKNEKTIIDVLTERSTDQRLDIAEAYKLLSAPGLVADLQAKLDGNLKEVLVATMTPLPEYLADHLEKALERKEKEAIWIIVEILFTVSDEAFAMIIQAYKTKYGQDFVDKLPEKDWADMKALIKLRSSVKRDQTNYVDIGLAETDAAAIVAEDVKKWGKPGSVVTEILLTRNHQQLALIFDKYEKKAKKSIRNTIEKNMPDQIEYTLLGLVQYIEARNDFFASRFKASEAGMFSTNDQDLIRLVVSRSEIDLAAIKKSYQKLYKKSLVAAVQGETKGKYKDALVALLGPET